MANSEDPDKTSLIERHLLPQLGSMTPADKQQLRERLQDYARVRRVVAYQYLEEPGPSTEGLAFLLPDSLAHSFHMVEDEGGARPIGTHIWTRRSLIFNAHALIDGLPRTEFTQALEPGIYLSIRYRELRQLMAEFSLVDRAMLILARQQERQRLTYHAIHRLPPDARVAAFEKQFRSFAHVASIQLRSMHVGLSRQTYSKKLP